MRIEEFSFGKIIIDGNMYTNDVIVYPEKVRPEWWRDDGHNCQPEDIDEIINYGPELLVIGTGDQGRMQIPEDTRSVVGDHDIELISAPTPQAVNLYNEKTKNGIKVVGAFNLTC